MNCLNKLLRKKIRKKYVLNLENSNFSIISSNCNGAFICHDLNQQFRSPFVNLWLKPNDFIKYLRDINHYMNCDLHFTKEEGINYPIGILDDIKIYFQHYSSEEEARFKWNDRSKRIDFDNLFILFTDRDGCTYQNLVDFNMLPFNNKVAFCHKSYPELNSAFYIKGFENDSCVGMCFDYVSQFSGHRYYDTFDFVKWLNRK